MIIVRWQLIRQEFKTNQNEKGTRLDIKRNATSIVAVLNIMFFQLIVKRRTFYFKTNRKLKAQYFILFLVFKLKELSK